VGGSGCGLFSDPQILLKGTDRHENSQSLSPLSEYQAICELEYDNSIELPQNQVIFELKVH